MLRTLGFALAVGLVLAGCPSGGGTGAAVSHGGGKPRGGGHGSGSAGAGAGTGAAVDGGVAGSAAGMACPALGCVFHPGLVGGAYFACLSSGAGSCFHFGAPCAPADACMYDAGAQRYRRCASSSEGRCATFEGSCTPTSACAFNPADRLHHTCDSERWADGRCGRWGPTCAP